MQSDCFSLQSCPSGSEFQLAGSKAANRIPSSSHANKVPFHSTSGSKSSGPQLKSFHSKSEEHLVRSGRLSSLSKGLGAEFNINKWHKAAEHACTQDHKHSSFLLLELTGCCFTGGCGKQPVYPRKHKDSTQLCSYKLFQQNQFKKQNKNPNIPLRTLSLQPASTKDDNCAFLPSTCARRFLLSGINPTSEATLVN